MANVATSLTAVPGGYLSCGGFLKVTPVTCTFDTVDSDLTVYTPSTGRKWAIVGLQYNEGSAHSITIKSGSTSIMTLEFSTNSGIQHSLGSGIYAIGLTADAALNIRCSTATISNMTVWVQEVDRLLLNR